MFAELCLSSLTCSFIHREDIKTENTSENLVASDSLIDL